jgi:ribosomal protein RSM22 (predicted rRNA methylase)
MEGLTLTDLDDFDSAYDGDDEDDDAVEEEEESFQPWKGLLEAPARATWRVADSQLPTDLAKSYEKILMDGDRTAKQLKRAHRKVLSMHTDLAEFRERERRRMVNGKSANDYDGDSIHPIYYGHEQTLSTLKHRLLPNYAIAKRVLEECRSLLGGPDSWSPKRIVDFGIGCGSSSVAALDMFNDVEWIHGIDPSQSMRECSERLIEGMTEGRETPPRVTYSTSLSADSGSSDGSFDLAICAYTATDLPGIMSTLAAAAILFEKLKPNGIFVMIEPGTPDGFNSIRSVRNMLLDCCPPDDPEFEWDERCHIIAPCTHNGQCPMERHKKNFVKRGKLAYDLPQEEREDDNEEVSEFAGNMSDFEDDESGEDFIDLSSHHGLMSETDAFNSSFCSFVQSLPGKDARKKGEKFSYLVAQKRIFGSSEDLSEDAFKHDRLTDLLARAQAAAAQNDSSSAQEIYEQAQDLESRYFDSDEDDLGLELIRGEEKRGSMGRIIRAPIKKKGHVYIDYCASPGRIIRSRVTKSASKIAPGIYSAARKSRWGGLWPDTMDRIFSPNK